MRRDLEGELLDRAQYTHDELRAKRRAEAAERLEELAAIAKAMAADLRGTGSSDEDADLTAYGRVYWLRKQVGYVVAKLGYGAPDTWVTKVAEREYGEGAGWKSFLRSD